MRKIPSPYTDPTPLFRHGGISKPRQNGFLDFSANINPLGPPAAVLRVLRDELPTIAHYPDPDCRELTERLAAHHGVRPDQIIVGNGSNELIYALARALRPKRVAIAEPTYTEYLRASLSVGAKVEHWLADGEHFDLEPFDPEGADMVWLCNPNNPTGRLWPPASRVLSPWIAAHPRTLFVVDEAFMPLCIGNTPNQLPAADGSLLAAVGRLENLIVLRSLTKYFALPGLRLGYAVVPVHARRLLLQHMVPWSVNGLAQVAGTAAWLDQDYREKTQQWLVEQISPVAGQPGLVNRVAAISSRLQPLPTAANFFLARLTGIPAAELHRRLRAEGILIRDASNFVGLDQRYIRLAIRTAAENDFLLNKLASLLEG